MSFYLWLCEKILSFRLFTCQHLLRTGHTLITRVLVASLLSPSFVMPVSVWAMPGDKDEGRPTYASAPPERDSNRRARERIRKSLDDISDSSISSAEEEAVPVVKVSTRKKPPSKKKATKLARHKKCGKKLSSLQAKEKAVTPPADTENERALQPVKDPASGSVRNSPAPPTDSASSHSQSPKTAKVVVVPQKGQQDQGQKEQSAASGSSTPVSQGQPVMPFQSGVPSLLAVPPIMPLHGSPLQSAQSGQTTQTVQMPMSFDAIPWVVPMLQNRQQTLKGDYNALSTCVAERKNAVDTRVSALEKLLKKQREELTNTIEEKLRVQADKIDALQLENTSLKESQVKTEAALKKAVKDKKVQDYKISILERAGVTRIGQEEKAAKERRAFAIELDRQKGAQQAAQTAGPSSLMAAYQTRLALAEQQIKTLSSLSFKEQDKIRLCTVIAVSNSLVTHTIPQMFDSLGMLNAIHQNMYLNNWHADKMVWSTQPRVCALGKALSRKQAQNLAREIQKNRTAIFSTASAPHAVHTTTGSNSAIPTGPSFGGLDALSANNVPPATSTATSTSTTNANTPATSTRSTGVRRPSSSSESPPAKSRRVNGRNSASQRSETPSNVLASVVQMMVDLSEEEDASDPSPRRSSERSFSRQSSTNDAPRTPTKNANRDEGSAVIEDDDALINDTPAGASDKEGNASDATIAYSLENSDSDDSLPSPGLSSSQESPLKKKSASRKSEIEPQRSARRQKASERTNEGGRKKAPETSVGSLPSAPQSLDWHKIVDEVSLLCSPSGVLADLPTLQGRDGQYGHKLRTHFLKKMHHLLQLGFVVIDDFPEALQCGEKTLFFFVPPKCYASNTLTQNRFRAFCQRHKPQDLLISVHPSTLSEKALAAYLPPLKDVAWEWPRPKTCAVAMGRRQKHIIDNLIPEDYVTDLWSYDANTQHEQNHGQDKEQLWWEGLPRLLSLTLKIKHLGDINPYASLTRLDLHACYGAILSGYDKQETLKAFQALPVRYLSYGGRPNTQKTKELLACMPSIEALMLTHMHLNNLKALMPSFATLEHLKYLFMHRGHESMGKMKLFLHTKKNKWDHPVTLFEHKDRKKVWDVYCNYVVASMHDAAKQR